MIFMTVGSMFPFERLVMEMDKWAEVHPAEDVFAQIGRGEYVPSHMKWVRMLDPQEFGRLMAEAEIIVAHAGMGSVITAAELRKPIVIVPRYAATREHTTDHQVHTANWLAGRPGLFVVTKDDALGGKIEEARQSAGMTGGMPRAAPEPFLEKIRQSLRS